MAISCSEVYPRRTKIYTVRATFLVRPLSTVRLVMECLHAVTRGQRHHVEIFRTEFDPKGHAK
jgi:hypothetical protein